MEKPKISIIVPVFNAENYLYRCIDSILAQTYNDFELILINDGSTDDSQTICENYARKDNRIIVIKRENGGVSSARQEALNKAAGKYVIHVDSDDWCDSLMLSDLYEKAESENADMVLCDYYMHIRNYDYYISQRPKSIDATQLQNQIFRQEIFGSLWNKLVRLEVIRRYSIRFPKEINLWEDAWFNCELLSHSLKITYLAKAYYHYDFHSNPNSMVRNVNRNTVFQQKTFVSHFEKKGVDGESLLITKCCVLEVAFYQSLFSCDEVCALFPEIRKKYLHRNFLKRQALCQCLLGNYRLAVIFRRLSICKIKLINSLKHAVKKTIRYE